jgi:hypothetical protein
MLIVWFSRIVIEPIFFALIHGTDSTFIEGTLFHSRSRLVGFQRSSRHVSSECYYDRLLSLFFIRSVPPVFIDRSSEILLFWMGLDLLFPPNCQSNLHESRTQSVDVTNK